MVLRARCRCATYQLGTDGMRRSCECRCLRHFRHAALLRLSMFMNNAMRKGLSRVRVRDRLRLLLPRLPLQQLLRSFPSATLSSIWMSPI
ncbi:uncharacterized protein M421DRAFT_347768 [Didymella exigua CBS 183.55]|uniref:Uncharacterized protein n=1 Tax=Didymella exigua CBS 183.55 TaxID=1150837 RepID=A0A6A5RWR2_9PLEO|nr:uncharacterized protein M421DRAFT_347768 [Didymella exigua CBS 183.55]KAF1931458.1 hypothetical protein M421DRAFT_347768 [Didymella exigua CBS 183.55]